MHHRGEGRRQRGPADLTGGRLRRRQLGMLALQLQQLAHEKDITPDMGTRDTGYGIGGSDVTGYNR